VGDLLIRNIPEALKSEIEQAARRDGKSLSATSIDLLRRSLLARRESDEKPFLSAWDALRPILYHGDDAEQQAFAKSMEDIEAARKRDFGRSVPDFG